MTERSKSELSASEPPFDAIWVAPDIASVHFQEQTLLTAGRPELAAGLYQVWLSERPLAQHPVALLHLGALMARLDRRTEAEAYLRQCIRLAPDLLGAHAELGRVLLASGDRDGAVAQWQLALALPGPSGAGAQHEVARMARWIDGIYRTAASGDVGVKADAPVRSTSTTALEVAPRADHSPGVPLIRGRRLRLLVRGWRGINHSYALVNQYQLIEFARHPDVELFHEDMPFVSPTWSKQDNGAGFDEAAAALINGIPPYDGDRLDATFSISSPLTLCQYRANRHANFVVTEFGLGPGSFAPDCQDASAFTRDANCVVTPSSWTRVKLIDAGMDPDGIHVVPHGIDPAIFFPASTVQRASARQAIGVGDDQFTFLNIGGSFWNKGIDLLVRAFAAVLREHPRARLVLKDNRKLYGTTSDDLIARLVQERPDEITPQVLGAINTIPGTLTLGQLASLYGAVDLYVSPYRAEGFNMPVLEAMACGLPVLVTAGGATDDFVTQGAGRFIRSRYVPVEQAVFPVGGSYLDPDFDDLVRSMLDSVTLGRAVERRTGVSAHLHWRGVSDKLLGLLAR